MDFAVIREPLEALAAAVILNVERALPGEIAKVRGAPLFLLLLTRVAETTFSTIRYVCAEKPEDPTRRLSFASSTPPLLRALLDEIFTVIFIGEDLPSRVEWYNKAGWRELREEFDRQVQRYIGKPGWDPWLARIPEVLNRLQVEVGITSAEAANPTVIKRWPTPSAMVSPLCQGALSVRRAPTSKPSSCAKLSTGSHLVVTHTRIAQSSGRDIGTKVGGRCWNLPDDAIKYGQHCRGIVRAGYSVR